MTVERRGSGNQGRGTHGAYSSLLDHISEVVLVVGIDGTIRYRNRAVEQLLGCHPGEWGDKRVFDFLHPQDLEPILQAFAAAKKEAISEKRIEFRFKSGDGTWHHAEGSLNASGSPDDPEIVLNFRDVTDNVRAKEEVRRLNESLEHRVNQLMAAMSEVEDQEHLLYESLERYRATFEQAAVGIAHMSADGRYLLANQRHCDIFGYSQRELLELSIQEITHPDDCITYLDGIRRLLANEIEVYTQEKRCFRKDGSIVWIFSTVSVVRGSSGEPRYLIVASEDISERKQIEETLEASEQLYRIVVEQSVENIFLVDVETKRILQANAMLRRSLGYGSEDLENMTLYDLVAHDRRSIDLNIRRLLDSGHYHIGERRYRRKDGTLATVEVSASIVPYHGREAICVVAHDITERKRDEENFRRSLSMLLALREAGQIMSSTLETEEIVSRLLEIMKYVSNLTATVISVPEEDGGWSVWRSAGLERLWPRVRFSPEAVAVREETLKNEGQNLVRIRRPDGASDTLVLLCLPLRARDRIVGVLEAFGTEALTERDTVEILVSLTSQAASALENAHLYGELAERERRLQELVGRLLGAQEEERRRVAYEVHDGLAQVAVAAHQRLQAFARRHPPSDEMGRKDLERILGLVRATVSDARRIIANLRPTTLDDLGLAATISLEVERMREEGYHVDYHEELGGERLPGAVEITLYRVTQEALTNVRKHARTEQVRVAIRRKKGEVTLEIQDYGQGFDPAAKSIGSGPGERVGLAGMYERVSMLGGKLEVDGQSDAGTSVVASVPLTPLLH